ncbi:hypothetical protein V8D89_011684 [Ganoderma adspersum]
MYDWVVTLAREVQLFWTGKARPLSAALYFSNKYLNLFVQVLTMVAIWDVSLSDEHCPTGSLCRVAGLRVDQEPLALHFKFNIIGGNIPTLGSLLANRISTIMADIGLIVITWKRILPGAAHRRFNITKKKELASVMLCDGMLYFITAGNGLITSLPHWTRLSSVLVSHFLLDLQEAYQRKAVALGTDNPLQTSSSFSIRSINFMPALGSLAATIAPAHFGREDGAEGIDVDCPGLEDISTFPDRREATGDVRPAVELTIVEETQSHISGRENIKRPP